MHQMAGITPDFLSCNRIVQSPTPRSLRDASVRWRKWQQHSHVRQQGGDPALDVNPRLYRRITAGNNVMAQ
jgi:hypothetical protein